MTLPDGQLFTIDDMTGLWIMALLIDYSSSYDDWKTKKINKHRSMQKNVMSAFHRKRYHRQTKQKKTFESNQNPLCFWWFDFFFFGFRIPNWWLECFFLFFVFWNPIIIIMILSFFILNDKIWPSGFS